VSVEAAGENLLVVKTQGGAAGIIAASLDKRHLAGVLGTIAGDDTVFIATVNRAAQKRARSVVDQLNSDWNR
jgi:transcriptional regulator of arginine metabolism